IIDYYFPETKDIERTTLYFDFDSVLEPIKSRVTTNVDIVKPPLGKLYGKKYIIDGEFNRREFRRYVRRQAHKNHMYGYTEIAEDDSVIIVVVSLKEKLFTRFENKIQNNFTCEIIEKLDWDKPIKMGFESVDNLDLTKREIRDLINENEKLVKENEVLTKRYTQIITSRAWKATYPTRTLFHGVKTLTRKIRGTNNDN